MATVYVTDPISSDVLEDLLSRHTTYCAYGDNAKSWVEVAPDIEAALVRTERITAEMIASAPRLKIVARHGVGVDNVDVKAASSKNVWVTVTPGANAPAVAEHVFALALSAARYTVEGSRAVACGVWRSAKPRFVGTQLQGKTMGIVGFGQVGRRVAQIASGFGMSCLVFDPFLSESEVSDAHVKLTQIDEVLERSDVLTLHVPLNAETHHMIDESALSRLKDGAILVNTSRGGLIDEAALGLEIRSGRLRAGLDVIEGESVSANDPLSSSMIDVELSGLVVTPHIAGQSDQSMTDVGNSAVARIDEAMAGGEPKFAVNRDDVKILAGPGV